MPLTILPKVNDTVVAIEGTNLSAKAYTNKQKADHAMKGSKTVIIRRFCFEKTSCTVSMFLKKRYPEIKKNIGTAVVQRP